MYEEFVKLTSSPEYVLVTGVINQYNEFKSPLYSEKNWEWVTVFTPSDHSEDFVATTEEPWWEELKEHIDSRFQIKKSTLLTLMPQASILILAVQMVAFIINTIVWRY